MIKQLSEDGGGVLKFPKKTFNITRTIKMWRNVVLEGHSGGTTLKDQLNTNNSNTKGKVIDFDGINSGHRVGGIRRMTLRGPFGGNPNHYSWVTARPKANNTMVNFRNSRNCFLDNVRIINSGGHPVSTWNSNGTGNHTFRNCFISGCWNKGQGGTGYFQLQSGYCLIYKCTIEKLRHFAIQNRGAKYNVVYKNTIRQDVNFHDDDSGNNLIEKNIIDINASLSNAGGAKRFSVMGPWANIHTVSRADNYVYANTIRGRNKRCTDNRRVYRGAKLHEPNVGSKPNGNPFATYTQVGRGKRFYSVRNGNRRSKAVEDKETIDLENTLKIFPNPMSSGNTLSVSIPGYLENPVLQIFDIQGKTVFNSNVLNGETFSVNLEQTRGLYLLKVTGDNDVLTSKLVIK